jgi:hypothetical protein
MEFKFFVGDQYNREEITWRTQTGRDMLIFFMTNNHIENTINCLQGNGLTIIPNPYNGRTHDEWIRIFNSELRARIYENNLI